MHEKIMRPTKTGVEELRSRKSGWVRPQRPATLAVVVASTLLAIPAFCQTYGQGYYDRTSSDRPYGDRDYARQDRALFDRARMDLDRASAYPYASKGDRKRFDEARSRLFDFESRFDQGRYEKHYLGEAIDHIQHRRVVQLARSGFAGRTFGGSPAYARLPGVPESPWGTGVLRSFGGRGAYCKGSVGAPGRSIRAS